MARNSKKTPGFRENTLIAKKYSRRSFLRHLALGTALAPLGWWDRAKAFPGYLGFFKKKITSALPALGGPYTLFTWGPMAQYLGYNPSWMIPMQIGTSTDWAFLTASASFTGSPSQGSVIYGIKSTGTLWAWGYNYVGQLGLSDTTDRSVPTQVGALTNWSRLSVSESGTVLAVKTNGTLWAWGNNSNGLLGDGTTVHKSSPVQIGALTNWSKVSTYLSYYGQGGVSAAVKTDGTLWTWGKGGPGLGQGAAAPHRSSPTQVGALTNWASVSCGEDFTVATKTNGTLWTWGRNSSGVLGDGTTVTKSSPVQIGALTNWSKVSASATHTVALKTDGTLWAWGYNNYGMLGLGHTNSASSPTQIGGLTTWTDVSATPYGCVAKKSDGTIWNWGWIATGYTSSPVQVGSGTNWSKIAENFRGGLTSDNKAWMWGTSTVTLAAFACNWPEFSPVQIGATNAWSDVASNGYVNLGIKTDGTLWSWGAGQLGSLGQGDEVTRWSPTQIGTGNNWLRVTTNVDLIAGAIKNDGSLWMWGYNGYGALGDGTVINRSSPVQVAGTWSRMVTRHQTTAAIKSDGTLWTWGLYDGYINMEDDGDYDDGDGPYEVFYGIYTSSPVQIGTSQWKELATGESSPDTVLAIKSDNTLWGWGGGGATLLGGTPTLYVPASSPIMVSSASWKKISANGHAMGIRTDGTLWGWGYNWDGQLGLGTNGNATNSPTQVGADNNWVDVFCGGNHTLAVKSDGTLWAWGNNTNLQFGNNTYPSTSSPVQIGSATNWKGVVGTWGGIYGVK